MHGLANLTRIEAKVLFLRDPVVLLVALAIPIGSLLVFGLPGFARDPPGHGPGGLALTLGVGAAWLGMAMPASVGWFALAFTLGTAALFAVGLLIAAVAPTARAANAIGLLAFFPSLFLAGAWLPKHQMPAWLSRIGDLTPLGAFREAVQDAWVGTTPAAAHLLAMAVVAVVAGVTAAKLFRWE